MRSRKPTSTVRLRPEMIHAARRRQLLTLAELSQVARISRCSLWTATSGRAVGFATVRRLASALGVNAEDLIERVAEG